MALYKGKVLWFNNAKGFGFLSTPGGADVFVHYTAIVSTGYRALKQGEPVEFDIVPGASGKPEAANVLRLDQPIASPADPSTSAGTGPA